MKTRVFYRLAALLAAVGILFGFAGCTRKKQIWIYTSLYKEVIAEMDPSLHQAVPEADIKWFQGGSENVASKLNAEIEAGSPKADLILTSEPFWYLELKKSGKLLPYESPAAKQVPAEYTDPDHAFVTVRIPVMVIGYNSQAYKKDQMPQKWKDLALSSWKDKISMGSPLDSGTNFTTVALLSKLYGWDYFADLRKNEVVAAGGNNSVITRIETRERPIGIVLLENILKAWAKGSPVRPIYPTEGALPVPSPIAILRTTSQPDLAKKVYDWFFSPAAQNAIVRSGMYSPVLRDAAPPNGPKWAELEAHQGPLKWSPQLLEQIYSSREQIKAKFSEVVLH